MGPLKYHIFLWIGNKAKDSSIKSTYSWCNKLLQSLSGRPVVYKESEGHESSLFRSTFQNVLIFDSVSVMYFNDTLDKPTLYRYKSVLLSNIRIYFPFRYCDGVLTEVEACVRHLGENSRDIMLLATSTNLFMWLLPQTWHVEPGAVWEAANVRISIVEFLLFLVHFKGLFNKEQPTTVGSTDNSYRTWRNKRFLCTHSLLAAF